MYTEQDAKSADDTQEVAKQPTSPEALAELPKLMLTQEELDRVSNMSAYGDNSEADKFMEDNGLKFGVDVIVFVEGQEQPRVYGTSREDFFTQDRKATNALVESLGLTPERPLELNEGLVVREMGDEAVQAAYNKAWNNEVAPSIEGDDTASEQEAPRPQEELDQPMNAPESDGSDVADPESPSEPEVSEVTPGLDMDRATKSFQERIAYIEDAARHQIDGYKHRETETLDLLIQRSSSIIDELHDIKRSLLRASDGAYGYGVAFNNIQERLHSLNQLLQNESGEIDHISGDTSRLDRDLDDHKEGELARQTRSFIEATGAQEGEALNAADMMNKYLYQAIDAIDDVKTAISTAREFNANQVAAVRQLIGLVDMMIPAAHAGHLDSNDVDMFAKSVRTLTDGFDENNGSHLKKVRSAIDLV